jgi:hypothetical protein
MLSAAIAKNMPQNIPGRGLRMEIKVMEIFPITDSFTYLAVKIGFLILVLLLWLALSKTPAV